MANFTGGPDWTDIEALLRALDGLHSGRTRLVILAEGAGSTGGLSIEMITEFDALPGGRQFPLVKTVSKYPCRDCATMSDHIFGGLYFHDVAIERAYEQLPLPEA